MKPPIVESWEENVDISEESMAYKSIWEVEQSYRCPLIGSCFDENEHKRILKKAGYQIKGMKLHEVHGYIMRNLHDENRISLKVEHYLRRKFRDLILTFGQLDQEKFRQQWNHSLQTGEFGGLFYIACIRRDLSESLLEDIFGDVHMLSHAAVNAVSLNKKQVSQLSAQNNDLKKRLDEQKRKNRELRKENDSLQRNLDEAMKLLESYKAEQSMDKGFTEVANGTTIENVHQDELSDLRLENQKLTKDLETYKRVENSLNQLLEEKDALNNHLKADIEDLISHFSRFPEMEGNPEIESIPEQDLESKRVLIVGGMSKIKHLYQHVVEMNGGEFEYHDGSLTNGRKGLDAKVLRSDLIICPINCNSHNACNRVKKLCRKHKKPLKMLSNASVSSISTALFSQKADLNAQWL